MEKLYQFLAVNWYVPRQLQEYHENEYKWKNYNNFKHICVTK
jgi:hypothetical protein